MALTNRQYSDIEREYESRRMRNIRRMQAKLDEAYLDFPRLSQIDEEYTALSMKKARARLGLGSADPSDEEKLADLSFERKVLLKRAGFKDGVISPDYDCPNCKDTGYIDGKKCPCFLKAERLMLSERLGLESILEKENFSTFSLGVYSDPPQGMHIQPQRPLRTILKKNIKTFIFTGRPASARPFSPTALQKRL